MRHVQIEVSARLLRRWFTVGGVAGTAMPRGMKAFPMRDSAATVEAIAEAYVNMDLATMRKFHEFVLKGTARPPAAAPLAYEEALLQGMGAVSGGSVGTVGAAPAPPNSPTQGEAAASAQGAPARKAVDKNVFDFTVRKYPAANKVKLIKELRAVSALPLQEAKAAVERCPGVLVKAMARADAEKLKTLFEGHGAEVELL
ncbi:ribosomal protein L7/L12 [Trypanosoma rangeli]|uniref:Ribosomal protein L7/L12 n=1 Tax=Trypanosoma rangeli TaxID=5698 RepID=A0A422NF54_TRYRA|nr:ribosomal protein L7/L12 [Trypanosoma rangeli]RNF04112.1 ribosomal protein L7/L12 [Trypanosoma rangeli]|eukprot:RNF04112.1 ribosomal protein L7/L12 [Trypanosoma rangeli]